MKKLSLIAALMPGTTTLAQAGIFDIPAHEPNGFRDTGCDEAARVEVRNDAGELHYVNNPTCGSAGGGGNAEFLAFYASTLPPAEEPEEEPADK